MLQITKGLKPSWHCYVLNPNLCKVASHSGINGLEITGNLNNIALKLLYPCHVALLRVIY